MFFGEKSWGSSTEIGMELAIQNQMIKENFSSAMFMERKVQLNVILEHLNFRMQYLLDQYISGKISLDQLIHGQSYHKDGDEGNSLEPYRDLLEHAKQFKDCINLFAGFIPGTYSEQIIQEGEEEVIKAAQEKGYLGEAVDKLVGTAFHYNMFESMLSGRDMHNPRIKPN